MSDEPFFWTTEIGDGDFKAGLDAGTCGEDFGTTFCSTFFSGCLVAA
jgi:hypothetical protein